MGKRKRTCDQNKTQRTCDQNKTPPPPAIMPYTYRMDSPSKEISSHAVGSSTLKSLSSIMDIMDSSGNAPNTRHSHQNNLSRAILLRHPRHYYGRQYSRRNSANNACASSSRGKGSLREEKLSFKIASQCNSDSGRQTENKGKVFYRPERIRSSSLAVDAASPNAAKMACGICEKLLKRKPYILGSTLSSGDLSVVAVLACGHVYHADCLELRTCHEYRRDPPCPLCVGLLSELDTSRGQQ